MLDLNIDPINEYFRKKGVEVCYNTLNSTQLLIRSYVKDFELMVDNLAKFGRSENIKYECYSSLYPLIEPRPKFTGFEKFRKSDSKFRQQIHSLVSKPELGSCMLVEVSEHNDINIDYKTALKQRVEKFDNPFLYMSGGLDGELLASSMIDAGVKFTPVIFQFLDNNGNIANDEDISYAYRFCARNGLFPIIREIRIESLWDSREFAELAIDSCIISPHLLTHIVMIKMMDSEFPGRQHLMGGEVRFHTRYFLDNGDRANVVQLAKTTPGYNGRTYTGTGDGGLAMTYAAIQLKYNTAATGDWAVSTYSDGDPVTLGGGSPYTGTWTTTPATSYQVQNSSVSASGSGGSWQPTAAGSYYSITSNLVICMISQTSGFTTRTVTFGINVRKTGTTTPVVSSTITLQATL